MTKKLARRRVLSGLAAVAALTLTGGMVVPSGPAQAGETTFADPPPGFDSPRKIILQLTSDDEAAVNNVLWNAINLQKFYGFDNVQLVIVAYGDGMKALYQDSPVADRIANQLKFDIQYIGCKNTMDTTGKTPDDLVPGVEWVQAGIAEIVERQLDGWITIAP
jgi:intracellular sulfur oxidation DsrE/DsrF family protein